MERIGKGIRDGCELKMLSMVAENVAVVDSVVDG